MTRDEKQKAINVLKISVPIMAMTQKEFNDYIQTLNQVMDWLEQEPTTKNDLGVDCISRKFMRDLGATCIAYRNDKQKLIPIISIDELPSVTPQEPRWIPVSEALPENPNESVLVCDIDGDIYKAYLSDYDGWRRSEDFEKVKSVRAWQPLPTPYKGE